MAELVKVKVLRALGGFEVNAERELSQSDAKRLEARGVVKIIGKAAKAPENKMEPKAENKAAPAPEAK